MTGPTLGQLAYEARQAAKGRRMGANDDWTDSQIVAVIALGWDELPAGMQADEETGAQAVLNQAFPGLREQVRLARQDRDQLRKHVLDQAAEYEAEAFRIAPPGAPEDPPDMADYVRAEAFNVAAARLRKIAEPPS